MILTMLPFQRSSSAVLHLRQAAAVGVVRSSGMSTRAALTTAALEHTRAHSVTSPLVSASLGTMAFPAEESTRVPSGEEAATGSGAGEASGDPRASAAAPSTAATTRRGTAAGAPRCGPRPGAGR